VHAAPGPGDAAGTGLSSTQLTAVTARGELGVYDMLPSSGDEETEEEDSSKGVLKHSRKRQKKAVKDKRKKHKKDKKGKRR